MELLAVFIAITVSLGFAWPVARKRLNEDFPGLRSHHHQRRLEDPRHARTADVRCSQPPSLVRSDACSALSCITHSDCQIGSSCCFNGCLYSCRRSIKHKPPVIDWMTVRGERVSGNYDTDEVDYDIQTGEELIESHNNQEKLGEPCTTTVDSEGIPPLRCPHGYICHVENQGEPERGVPNSGRCMLLDPRMEMDESAFNST